MGRTTPRRRHFWPREQAEIDLDHALQAVPAGLRRIEQEDFGGAMAALALLRIPLDAFFDKVTVNAHPDPTEAAGHRVDDASYGRIQRPSA